MNPNQLNKRILELNMLLNLLEQDKILEVERIYEPLLIEKLISEEIVNREKCESIIRNKDVDIIRLQKEIKRVQEELWQNIEKCTELNQLLYCAKRNLIAYEKLPDVKLYNFLRKLKHRRKKAQDVVSIKNNIIEVRSDQKNNFEYKKEENNEPYRRPAEFFPEFILKIENLKDIKLAAILDEFSLLSYASECNLMQLTPENWREEIDSFCPDMLFIESAWKGKHDLWYRKIARPSKEIKELTDYCREIGIPIVFWNKEDPTYNGSFMATAKCADFVFTTDIDCIGEYKKQLEHDRVYLLHFAAQPKVHNPIEKYDRKDMFSFAGAYYHNYKNRAKIFDIFAHYAIRTKGIDIFDRNYKSALPEHAFPDYYDYYIKGKLPPEEIDIAYKGYKYSINMNSITSSQTMFARRVFELMASNTIVVGNYSRAVVNYFGDLTINTDNVRTLESSIERFCFDRMTMRKYRLSALRKVLLEHLYEDRLGFMVNKVFGRDIRPGLVKITVVSKPENEEQMRRILEMFSRQSYNNSTLILIMPNEVAYEGDDRRISIIRVNEVHNMTVQNAVCDGFLAYFDPKDWYGENYLIDMILTLRYGSYSVIGKGAFFANRDGIAIVENDECVYRNTSALPLRRAIVNSQLLKDKKITELDGNMLPPDDKTFAIDEFNYCENWLENECEAASDMDIRYKGMSVSELNEAAENIPAKKDSFQGFSFGAKDIHQMFGFSDNLLSIRPSNEELGIQSSYAPSNHRYFYHSKRFDMTDIVSNAGFDIEFSGTGYCDIILACIFFNDTGERISDVYLNLGQLKHIESPKNAVSVQFAVRVKGNGRSGIKGIRFGIISDESLKKIIPASNVLVLTNQYPSYSELYRNMFVHRRLMCYRDAGLRFDVLSMQSGRQQSYREFEGISVSEGGSRTLEGILASGMIKTVCIHFLDRDMWNVLKRYVGEIRIFIWIHGSEIQPWHRREYNYETSEELDKAKEASQKRMDFWREVFAHHEATGLHFIFVSQYFAKEVFEDYSIELPKHSYSVIHNCIDTELFSYEKKNADQRLKLLSIRPYANHTYANDVTVNCIQELSTKPYFSELSFLIIGRGQLFSTLVDPLKIFNNVTIQEGFLDQKEISKLHKQYGVFLVPTRMDSQGVSRDEAMSSGLVPVTNKVAAIPEFADESCAIIAPPEDYLAMAEGIDRLYHDPELFLTMSEKAALRVRSQTSRKYTIDKEIEIIYGCNNHNL